VEAQGAITIKPDNTVSPASSNPTLRINTPLTAITHTTTGATGISNAGVSGANGLPAGVSAAWAGNTITISGTPTVAGTYSYSIPLTGGCGSVSAPGTITVINCGAFVASGVWKAFMCHNLGADQSADPFTPSWRLNGDYYQWGRATVAAAGPTGPSSTEANAGDIAGWNTTEAPNGAWSDAIKTVNDPCPTGFRVPTKAQWGAVINTDLNPTQIRLGTWSYNSNTNYSSGLRVGAGSSSLYLPAAGAYLGDGLFSRGFFGYYRSTSEDGSQPWFLYFGYSGSDMGSFMDRTPGMSIRCVAE
jgi:uncharacterized protein (TIGR02145 family)